MRYIPLPKIIVQIFMSQRKKNVNGKGNYLVKIVTSIGLRKLRSLNRFGMSTICIHHILHKIFNDLKYVTYVKVEK